MFFFLVSVTRHHFLHRCEQLETEQKVTITLKTFRGLSEVDIVESFVAFTAWCRMTVGPRPVSAPLPYSQIRSARGRTAQPESKGETNLTFSSSLVD